MQSIITEKLQNAFLPIHLHVLNESHLHHRPGNNSHFNVVIVSEQFDGLRLLARHRAVNTTLAEELAGELHALAIHTYTPAEWAEVENNNFNSPSCVGLGD